MARDLETLRVKLWELFEEAADKHKNYADGTYDQYTSTKMANRQGMASLANALVNTEREIRARDEAQKGLKLPGKPKVAANKA